jgi:hypothetical protein
VEGSAVVSELRKVEKEAMKLLRTLLATLLPTMAVLNVLSAAPQAPASKPWSAAKYHGLVVGTSTREDVLRLLGKPDAVGKEQDTGAPTTTYTVSDPVPGTLVIYTKKRLLEGMTLYPKASLTKRDVIRLFGSDFILVRYAVDDCLDSGGAGPIYQSPRGPIKHMEYRDRGLAIAFESDDDQKVEAILYTEKPFGPTHSQCIERSKKNRPEKAGCPTSRL